MTVGAIYKSPDLLVEFGYYVRSKYDFADDACRFFFDCAMVLYQKRTQEFSKSTIIAFMTEDNERLMQYKQYGGWKTLESWMKLACVDDFKNYFDILKKNSLLREYERRGFDVERIKHHKRFEMLTADDIYKAMRGRVDKIKTIIMGDSDIEVLNSNVSSMVNACLEKPDIGYQIPFKILNEAFRGMQRGTTMAFAAMSNAGKSRFMIKIIAYAALVLKEKTLVLLNEMTVDKMRKALLTTVVNNPEYEALHGIHLRKSEREIVLGLYRDDSTGEFVRRKMDASGNFTESMEAYISRLTACSTEYQKVKAISEWIEAESQESIYVKDVCMDYSDSTLQFEIRKAVMTRGVTMWFFDTFKNSQVGEWSAMKITATTLSEISKSLNVFGYLSMQLNDETNNIMPDELSSSNIAECKPVKHVLDSLIMVKEIDKRQYGKYEYLFDDPDWGKPIPKSLKDDKRYYCFVVDKNRGGEKPKLLYELDLDLNTWSEVGRIIRR